MRGELAGQPCAVRAEGVSKEFVGEDGRVVRALDEVDLTIEPGEFIAIVGASGCGKSTLLSIVAGLMPPSTGRVLIGDQPVSGPFGSMGVAFQKDLLLEWRTVLDNVLLQIEVRGLTKAHYEPLARELLGLTGLDGFADVYPSQLSGGMRQRVAVCRALIHDPALLLMDEPFAALDLLTRDQLALDFQKLWLEVRKTVLFITHSIEEAVFLADRVIVFTPRPGRVSKVIDVDLKRPRHLADRDSPEFASYVKTVRQVMADFGILKD